MDIQAFFDAEFEHHQDTVAATRAVLAEPFARLVEISVDSLRRGGKLLFFGNGGSAADAQHIATELTVRYKEDRAAIAGMALTTDTSSLTAIGNDFGFEELFARQVVALGRAGDVAIGISTSGNSENVIRGLKAAQQLGITAAGFTGRDGGRMVGLADPMLLVPSSDTARIQEMHILAGHMLCGAIEKKLGLLP